MIKIFTNKEKLGIAACLLGKCKVHFGDKMGMIPKGQTGKYI